MYTRWVAQVKFASRCAGHFASLVRLICAFHFNFLVTLAGRKILAFIALFFFASLSMAEVAVPPLVSRVTDLTGTLSTAETRSWSKNWLHLRRERVARSPC